MTLKKEGNTQPKTAKELKEAGLFKLSAEIPSELYLAFKSECAKQGYKVKSQVEAALRNHLKLMEKSSDDR